MLFVTKKKELNLYLVLTKLVIKEYLKHIIDLKEIITGPI